METTRTDSRSIVIVGAGAEAWLAAAILRQHLPPSHCRLTVVQHPSPHGHRSETCGPAFVRMLDRLRIPQATAMRASDATYSLGTRYCGWSASGSEFWIPFGPCGVPIDGQDLFHVWLAEQKRHGNIRPYHTWSLHAASAMAGRAPHSFRAFSPMTQDHSYGLQIDLRGMAAFLRTSVADSDVHVISGQVVSGKRDETGNVVSLQLNSGDDVAADFVLDVTPELVVCSPTRSVAQACIPAAGQFSESMPAPGEWTAMADRIVTLSIPSRRSIPSCSTIQAVPEGWILSRSLKSRTDYELHFSSDLTDEETARMVLWNFAGPRISADAEFTVSVNTDACVSDLWTRNTLAAGRLISVATSPGAGPLRQLQAAIELFVQVFPVTGTIEPSRCFYNRQMNGIVTQLRDWRQLHYHLSRRSDAGFWKTAAGIPISESLQKRLSLYDDTGRILEAQRPIVPEADWYFLLTGCDRLPRRASVTALNVPYGQIQEVLTAIESQQDAVIRDLALHEELLDQIHQVPVAKAS
ncbi:MAG: tryptophan 7-halogenase [Planctomycetaceae bacterium]|nr:tryptophan 7-halogenase [Planctomycetaceae bacterium]